MSNGWRQPEGSAVVPVWGLRPQSRSVWRRIRDRLRDIDYHSARRPSTRWSRLSDRWLLASFPVAVFAMAIGAVLSRTDETRSIAMGVLGINDGGALVASVSPGGTSVASPGRFRAGLEIVQRSRGAGWPLLVWEETHGAQVLLSDGGTTRVLDLREPIVETAVIRRALAQHHPALLALCSTETASRIRYGAFGGAIVVTWILILPLGLGAIQFVRIGSAFVMRRQETRRRVRRSSYRCLECGYDLRGSEFSAACPECGTLTR